MTRDELLKLHQELCDQARALMVKKNHDYAGADGTTPFANFEACELLGICSTETGMLVRMCDKFMRLIQYVKSGCLAVKGETRTDTCVDSVNYSILLDGYCRSKHGVAEVLIPGRRGKQIQPQEAANATATHTTVRKMTDAEILAIVKEVTDKGYDGWTRLVGYEPADKGWVDGSNQPMKKTNRRAKHD